MRTRILSLSLLLALFTSCIKDDDSNDQGVPDPIKNYQRITRMSIVNSAGEITKQTRYTYERDNLVRVANYSNYDGELVELNRTEFTYSLNEITGFESRSSDFQKVDTKYVYKFNNGNRTQYSRYTLTEAGQFDERERIIYAYEYDKLVSSTGYYKRDGNTLLELMRRRQKYDGGKLKESTVSLNASNVWQDQLKIFLYYEGAKLVKRIEQAYENGSWTESVVIDYSYNGDVLKQAAFRTKYSTEPLIYKYEKNYLVEVLVGNDRTVYEYEPGHGNYSLIYDNPGEMALDLQNVR